jgi:hypothetical protein
MAREREVHKLLTRERILGLDLVKGVKAGAVAVAAATAPFGDVESISADSERATSARPESPDSEAGNGAPEGEQVTGLPLFGKKAESDI